jgi:hypothetical protein
VVDTEVGVYVPLALGIVRMLRGRYADAERELKNCVERLDNLCLKRPGDEQSMLAQAAAVLVMGKAAAALDDPTLAGDPLRPGRCANLRAVASQQLAAASWQTYLFRSGMVALRHADADRHHLKGMLSGDLDEDVGVVGDDTDLHLEDAGSPTSQPGRRLSRRLSRKESLGRGSIADRGSFTEQESFTERDRAAGSINAGDRGNIHKPLSSNERHSILGHEVRAGVI